MRLRTTVIIVYLVIILFSILLSVASAGIKTDKQIRIEPVINSAKPLMGERQFTLLNRKVLERKFYMVSVDLDTDDNLFVLDLMQKKIFKFDKAGTFQKIIESPVFVEPGLLLVDYCNRVLVRDKKNLHVFSREGAYQKTIKFPFYLGEFAVTKKDLILISSEVLARGELRRQVNVFDFTGKQVRKIFEQSDNVPQGANTSLQFHPKLLIRHNKKMAVIAYTANYELYLIDENGDIKAVIKKEESPQPLSREDLKQIKEAKVPVWIPKFKPLFYDLFIDDEGNIYVEKWTEGDPRKDRYFDVFDNNGKFIYKINKLPAELLLSIQKDKMITAIPMKGSPYLQVSFIQYSLGE
jgi:hypothetical protein